MDLILSLDYNLHGAFQVAGVVGHAGYPVFWAPKGICFRVWYLAWVPLVGTNVALYAMDAGFCQHSPMGKLTLFWEWGAEFLVCFSILYLVLFAVPEPHRGPGIPAVSLRLLGGV